ncbi:hypothetical protein XELAEV_18024287mg [Xenopus laevis]|uniref:Uncharacterized protein n=1 Tax=Xenopus laevis TaxID=8355 RepID=A0A974CYL3_XENLA|nr:hypothetical protein XELAEV_18024287mg [Xenopus laevis]
MLLQCAPFCSQIRAGERNLGQAVSSQSVGATDGSNPAASSFVCRERLEESSEIRPSVTSKTYSLVLEPPKFKNLTQMSLRQVDKTPRADHNVFGLIPIREKQSEAFIFPDTGVAKSKMAANVILHP